MEKAPETAALTIPVTKSDHTLGPARAPLTLVEYGDYECSFCGRAQPIVKAVRAHLDDRLRFVFRHFPLTGVHRHAQSAAEAAEAAGAQDKFWEMHEMLFANQTKLHDEHLKDYARQVGLDEARFDRFMTEHTGSSRIHDDFMGDVRSGVNGTPTFFINGSRYDGPAETRPLLAALEAADKKHRRAR